MTNHKTKFIIFGQSRSGSTLLLDLLNSHPDICCDTEIFNKNELFPKIKPLQWFYRQNPSWLAQNKLRKSTCPVYGFKLFFFQVHHPAKFLEWLVKNDWKIIHVQRENIFRQSLSNIIALTTNHWHRRSEKSNPEKSIHVDPARLLRVLKNRSRWKLKEKNLLGNYDHITVNYERHLADKTMWQEAANEVFNYLGLPPAAVKTSLKPTYKKPYSEIIENYNELIESVKNSEFAYMLLQEK